MSFVIQLPKVCQNAVNQIDELFKSNVKSSQIEIRFETSIVKDENMEKYIDLLVKQFKVCEDSSEKANFEKLKFTESHENTKLVRTNNPKFGEYSWLLLCLRKHSETQKKVMVFYYSNKVEFSALTSAFKRLFGTSINLEEICSEDNMRMYFAYRLVKYAQSHDKDIKIEFS